MLKTYSGISDLNFSVGHPLQVEDFGELKPVYVDPPIEALTPHQTEQIALTLMQGNRRLIYDYLTGGSCDCSYSLSDQARFRVNIFRQQGHFSVVLRKLQSEVPTIENGDVSKDGKRLTYKLRRDMKWSDGVEFIRGDAAVTRCSGGRWAQLRGGRGLTYDRCERFS